MHLHVHDENSAPNQVDEDKPTDMEAGHARGIPEAEPPLEGKGAHNGHRDKTAAGFYAIYETGHFGLKEMGIGRSLKTLLKINQKDGFDLLRLIETAF